MLGCCIIDKTAFDRISDKVTAADFYEPRHAIVFRAMIALSASGVRADIHTVIDWLNTQNLLNRMGGRDVVIALTDDVWSAANCERYAEIVKEHSRRRHLIQSLSGICTEAMDCEDPDELCARAEATINTNRSRTQAVESYLYDHAEDMMKPAVGVKTGFWQLDNRIVCLENGCLIIVGGFTGMGKTAFGYALAHNAVLAGHKAALFSFEMTDKQQAHRVASSETGIPLHRIRTGDINDVERDLCMQSLFRVPVMYFFNCPRKVGFIKAQLQRMEAQDRPNMIVVDHLKFMSPEHRQDRHDLEIGSITSGLKQLAISMNIPVVTISHLSRVKEDREPMLSDLRGSGDIEQDADVVMFVHRRKETPLMADVIIAKGRQDGAGRVQLPFYSECASFNKPPSIQQTVLPIGV